MIALSPCPWCKSADVSGETIHVSANGVRGFVECQACWVRGPLSGVIIADTATDLAIAHVRARRVATDGWNTRTLSPQTLPASGEVERHIVGGDDSEGVQPITASGAIAAAKALATVAAANDEAWPPDAVHELGAWVQKKGRASWRGRIVGWYRTNITALGYAVESAYEPGSVQIYPETALLPLDPAAIRLLSQGGGSE